MKETPLKNIPVRDMGKQSQSYCSSKLAQERRLAVLGHNRQRGKMQNTLFSPAKIPREEHEYH